MLDHLPRLLRALVVATVVLTLSTAAHLEGGGALPAPGVLLGLVAAVVLAVAPFTRRALRPHTLLALLAGGQLVLHHGLVGLTATARCAPVELHLHHVVLACTGAPVEPLQLAGGGGGAVMVATHAVATLLSAAVITHGEHVLRTALRWLSPLLDLPRPVSLHLAPAMPVAAHDRPLHTSYFLTSPPLRGPPLTD